MRDHPIKVIRAFRRLLDIEILGDRTGRDRAMYVTISNDLFHWLRVPDDEREPLHLV